MDAVVRRSKRYGSTAKFCVLLRVGFSPPLLSSSFSPFLVPSPGPFFTTYFTIFQSSTRSLFFYFLLFPIFHFFLLFIFQCCPIFNFHFPSFHLLFYQVLSRSLASLVPPPSPLTDRANVFQGAPIGPHYNGRRGRVRLCRGPCLHRRDYAAARQGTVDGSHW